MGVYNATAEGDPPGGHTPLAWQGASYRLANLVPEGDGSALRVTGYGRDPYQDNAVQQTATGPYQSRDANNDIFYIVDTRHGNSGSAVEHVCGLVYGIAWYVFCPVGPANRGKSIDLGYIQSAVTPDLVDDKYLEPQGVTADCNNNIPDWCDVACVYPYGTCPTPCGGYPDCNGNLVPDGCEPQIDGTGDCNGNELQDICEIASGAVPDCNFNSVPDECDITSGFSEDVNENDIPDQCEPTTDCNGNGREDVCDVAGGFAADCNENFIPDECDEDCDEHGTPDECDIAAAPVRDCYDGGDGYLDECQPAVPKGRCCIFQFGTLCIDDATECFCDFRNGTYGGDGSTCGRHGCMIYGPQQGP